MLLDLSGLTREERVMVHASVSNERDFDRVAEALIIQHPRIHLRESQRRAKGKGKEGYKRVDSGFAEKTKASTLAAENPERVLITRISLPLRTRMNLQTSIKPTTTRLILEAMTEKKLRNTMMTRKAIRFLRMLL